MLVRVLLSMLSVALRLMTYNVNYANPSPATALDAIAAADVDVVLLQEITSAWQQVLEARFAETYPHRVYRIDRRAAGGLAVLSKRAIREEAVWPAPAGTGAWFPAQRLVIDGIQLLHVHLRPAIIDGSWVKGFLTTPPIRRAEIAAHWARLDGTLPTIVAGDFNEDATGRALDFLAGHGLARVPTRGPTTWHYPQTSRSGVVSDLLKMDIDHVVLDGRLAGSDAHVIDAGHSDHRPVVVAISRRPSS